MSQSDYIKFKKTSMILKNQELPPVLDPETYVDGTRYNLETTVPNTKNVYSRLLPSNRKYFFDIEKNVATCPTFILCKNTNTRPNRVLNTEQKIIAGNGQTIPYTPLTNRKFVMLNGKTISYTAKPGTGQKLYTPNTCTFKNGSITRKCICSKKVCKCGTDYCGSS